MIICMYKIICVTNRKICEDDFLNRIERISEVGISGIILREKDMNEDDYFYLAKDVIDICKKNNISCMLHGFSDTAIKLGADKIHFPLDILRKIPESEKKNFSVIGVSCHSAEDAEEAFSLGASYITAGHIFDTDCKKGLPGRGVDFLKKVHATEMDHGSLPYAAEIFEKYLDTVKKYLTDEQYSTLKGYFSKFPADDHFVHGDFQMKNVMMTNGEPMLIDMDTLSAGHPIFDLAGLYVTYCSFREDDPNNSMDFLGISNETAEYIWNKVIRLYFDDRSDDDILDIQNKICLVAVIRFLYLIEISELKNNEFAEIRIRRSKEHIRELLEKVDGLYFE